jgi:PAS domain S-box-containing protein
MSEVKKRTLSSPTGPAQEAEILKKLASVEAENADLQRRLAESEAALHALIAGQADAVMDTATATPLLLQQTQKALQISESRFRGLTETTLAAIFIIRDERIHYANPAASLITGYSNDELVGMEFWQIADPTSQEQLKQNGVASLFADCVPARCELELLTREGEQRWVDITLGEIEYEGQPARGLTAFEISKRKDAEAALQKAKEELERRVVERTSELQRSRQRNTDILNSIKDGFFALDKEGRFLYINLVSAQNGGYQPEELVGQIMWEKFPGYRGSLFEEKCREVMEQGQVVHFEVPGIIREKYYEVSIYPATEGVSVYWIDVSERKQAELALQKERDRAQSYLNIAGAMIVVLDADQKVALINARGCQILGRPEEEIVGANWFDTFIPERMRTEIKAVFAQLMDGEIGSLDYYENPVLTQDGEERLVAWRNVILRDEDGHITGTLSSGEDITERKRIERDLRQAYELLETVTQGTEVIIAVVDTDFRYLYFNKAYAEEIQRLAGKELTVGVSMVELFADMPEQQKIAVEAWSPTLRGERTTLIVEFGDPGRYRRIYRTLKTPLWDAAGNVIGAGEVAWDVTKQVQAEEALRASEKRYHALFNGMTEGFAVHRIICDDYGTPTDYHFLDVNPAFERLTGLNRKDVVGKDKSQIPQLQNDDPKWIEIYGKVALSGEPVHFENYSPALKRHYEVYSYRPEPGQFAVLFLDITARKRAEQQIEILARFPGENPYPVMRIDRDGKLVYANKASQPFLEVWNCEAGQILPQTWRDLAVETLATEQGKNADVRCGDIIYSVMFVPVPEAGYVNLYGREVTEQVKALKALQKARNELEARVRERTQALEIINEQLHTEVTERTRAEEALHSAYAYNRSLIDASLDPLVTITPEGKIGDVNIATEAVTGYSREELIGTDFHGYFTDPHKARLGYQQVFELGAVRDYELEIRHKDGHITPVLYNASVYRDETGSVVGIFAAARDITLRKQAEQELQKQEELLRTVMENLPVGVWIADATGNILQGNLAGQSIWAGACYVGVENYGEYKGWWVSNGKPIAPDEWAAARAVRKGETSLNEEIEIECFDGTHKIILNSAIPLRDAQQAIMGAIVVNQDITEIKRAQKELDADRRRLLLLSQSEREQRLFAESLAQTMLILNSSLNLNEVLDCILEQIQSAIPFRSANVALLEDGQVRVARQRGSESLPAGFDMLQDSFQQEAFPLWKRLSEKRQVLLVPDLKTETEWGSLPGYAWARAYLGAALKSGEKVVGFINVFSDRPGFFSQEAASRLTAFASQAALAIQNARLYRDLERSLAQEQNMRSQLVQAEKFAAMGRMLASVAHELNNPLQTIQNCLYLTQQDTPAGSPIHEYLEMAFSEIGRLSRMVAQLRELYRPRSAMQIRSNNLCQILDEAHALLAPHLQNQQVVWQQSPGPERLIANCDADQIKQVFINISMNAIEAMQPNGGTLSIQVILSEDARQAGVIFRDTGPGIPPEILQNLFEPFFTTKSSGLGLGLSICYELVHRHNGQITAESQVNEGSIFTIWLPLAEDQNAP